MVDNKSKTVYESKDSPLKKICFGNESKHYTVAFYDQEENSIDLCLSSQIGCVENCEFCATGNHPFIRNLSQKEMEQQYIEGLNSVRDYMNKHKPKNLYLVIEGMGEPSYNIYNCLNSFSSMRNKLKNEFDKIIYRVSTVGNISMIPKYKDFIKESKKLFEETEFQFQVSLHSPFNSEREYLIPGMAKKYRLEDVISYFREFSEFLNTGLKCNYMLLNFPDGRNNYSQEHLNRLSDLLNSANDNIKLTKYSETNKGFSSPSNKQFSYVKDYLLKRGVSTKIKEIMGNDVNAACGMLHY